MRRFKHTHGVGGRQPFGDCRLLLLHGHIFDLKRALNPRTGEPVRTLVPKREDDSCVRKSASRVRPDRRRRTRARAAIHTPTEYRGGAVG